MKIKAILEKVRPSFSFEFFPPKNSEGFEQLFTTIGQLESCQPTYVSVTFGAGGSTRAQTIDLVGRIKNEIGLETMAHLTCVGSSQEELRSVLGKVVWRRSAWHAHLTRLQTVAAFPEHVPGHAEDVRSVGCSDWCWNASHRFSRASPLVGLTLMSLNSSPQGDLESTWRKRGEQRIWGDHSSVEKDERSIEVMGTSSNMAARPVYLVVPASRAKCGSVDC